MQARRSAPSMRRRKSWDFCFSPEMKMHFIHKLKDCRKRKGWESQRPESHKPDQCEQKEELPLKKAPYVRPRAGGL